MSRLDSLQLPAFTVRWLLEGPAGPHLDLLVAHLVGAGVHIECIVIGTAYRLNGPALVLEALSAELKTADLGIALGFEAAPVESVGLHTALIPKHAPRRSVTVHGAGVHAAAFVRQAIDAGLSVTTSGLSRWSVAGRSAALVAWLATAWNRPADDVMQSLGVTAGMLAAEDDPQPFSPVVNVVLPDRRIVSRITRDLDGDITNVEQTETTPQ